MNDRSRPSQGGSEMMTTATVNNSVEPAAVMSREEAECSPLRRALDDVIAEAKANGGRKLSMKALTVMSEQSDPFRLDTPANHKLGKWLANTAATLGLGDRKIHNRGLHYMILGQPKPDGSTYVSDEACWTLLEEASKYARWLGYLPFDQIIDQRNAPPVVRIFEQPMPIPFINVGIDIEIPAADDIIPKLGVADFTGIQPYKLVLVGEKSSLGEVLAPIANDFGADLYLPSGDISDTMVYQMGKGRRRRRPANGGLVLRRRRPIGLVHGNRRCPQVAGVQGLALPRS
jgi:hypothetical protein